MVLPSLAPQIMYLEHDHLLSDLVGPSHFLLVTHQQDIGSTPGVSCVYTTTLLSLQLLYSIIDIYMQYTFVLGIYSSEFWVEQQQDIIHIKKTIVGVTWPKLTNNATVFCLLRHVSCEEGNIAHQRGTFIIIWLGNIHLWWNMWFYVMTKYYAWII